MENLTLERAINLTLTKILEADKTHPEGLQLNLSGGKDSLVLENLMDRSGVDYVSRYADTGKDRPDVRRMARAHADEVVYPKLSFSEVIKQYGWVAPSKEISYLVHNARRGMPSAVAAFEGRHVDGSEWPWAVSHFVKWKWLVDSDISISHMCCQILKERPLKSKRYPMVGIRNSESARRRASWARSGCLTKTTGRPLSLWSDSNIEEYIKLEKIDIPECYGHVKRTGCVGCLAGITCDKKRLIDVKNEFPGRYIGLQKLGIEDVAGRFGAVIPKDL